MPHPLPANPEESDDPESLPHLVHRLARRLRAARLQAFEPLGLAPHQVRALLTVARATRPAPDDPGATPELRLTDLATRLHITPRSATDVVDALEAKGLLRRRPSATDRRATSLTLTDQGREMIAAVRQTDAEDQVFATLTERQRADLRDLLSHLTESTP